MGILRFTNRNAIEGFYPENEAMPQESNAKRLLKNQIKEFYSRVMDDVNFKNAIITFMQEIKVTEVTPRLTALVIKEVILPYSRYLGYNFSLRDLLDFEANEKVMVKIPAEEMAMITGGGEVRDNVYMLLSGIASLVISGLSIWQNGIHPSESIGGFNYSALATGALGVGLVGRSFYRFGQMLNSYEESRAKKPGAPPAGGINVTVNEPQIGNTRTTSGNTITNSSVPKTD